MAKYLLSTTETYRVDSEAEAAALIEEAKHDSFGVTKYVSTYKKHTAKGEIVDEWYRVTLTREFTKEREPEDEVSIKYTNGAF